MDKKLLDYQVTKLNSHTFEIVEDNISLKESLLSTSLQFAKEHEQEHEPLICKRTCAYLLTKFVGILSQRSIDNNLFILPDVAYYMCLRDKSTSETDMIISEFFKEYKELYLTTPESIIKNAFSSDKTFIETYINKKEQSIEEEKNNQEETETSSEEETETSSEEER